MLEVKVNVPEIRSFINEIIDTPGRVFEIVSYNARESVSNFLNDLMNLELTALLGRNRYEHQKDEEVGNYRNGSYVRRF